MRCSTSSRASNENPTQTPPSSRRAAFVVKAELAVLDEVSALIGEAANGDHDDVDDPPHAESTTGQEHEDSRADLADVETVNAEATEEDCQQKCGDEAFIADVVLSHTSMVSPN